MIESDQNKPSNPHILDDEIDLRELFNAIWEGKILIILITFIFAIFSVIYSLTLVDHYRSESILVARDFQGPGALSEYSGLASLAGVNLPSSGGNSVNEVMEIIKSREFVKHLITFEDVLPSVMAAKSYDTASQELYFDPETYNGETKTWVRKPSKNKDIKPSYLEMHKVYRDLLSISQDDDTGFVSIMVEHISPIFAKDFLTLIIKEANTLNRETDINDSSKALGYLKTELSQTSLVEIKKSINQLIEIQLETQMATKIYKDYSLVMIEPPFVPEQKFKPARSNIVIISTMLGSILGVILVLVWHYSLGKRIINKDTIV